MGVQITPTIHLIGGDQVYKSFLIKPLLYFKHKKAGPALNRNHIYHLPEYGTKQAGSEFFIFQFLTQTETGSLMVFDGKQVLKIDSSIIIQLVGFWTFTHEEVLIFYSKDEKSLWLAVDKKGVYHYELTKGDICIKRKIIAG